MGMNGAVCNWDRGAPRDAAPPTPAGIRVRTTAVRLDERSPGVQLRKSDLLCQPPVNLTMPSKSVFKPNSRHPVRMSSLASCMPELNRCQREGDFLCTPASHARGACLA